VGESRGSILFIRRPITCVCVRVRVRVCAWSTAATLTLRSHQSRKSRRGTDDFRYKKKIKFYIVIRSASRSILFPRVTRTRYKTSSNRDKQRRNKFRVEAEKARERESVVRTYTFIYTCQSRACWMTKRLRDGAAVSRARVQRDRRRDARIGTARVADDSRIAAVAASNHTRFARTSGTRSRWTRHHRRRRRAAVTFRRGADSRRWRFRRRRSARSVRGRRHIARCLVFRRDCWRFAVSAFLARVRSVAKSERFTRIREMVRADVVDTRNSFLSPSARRAAGSPMFSRTT